MIQVFCRNTSGIKGLYHAANLAALARRVARGEQVAHNPELSVLFCDDAFIADLNETYRQKRGATDVLAFPQTAPESDEGGHSLGDIVISLETVQQRNEDQASARADLRMLFCHGLLHLLGYDHHNSTEQAEMVAKQAEYLGCSHEEAWRDGRGADGPKTAKSTRLEA